jgi:hypothetical protein
MIGNYFARLTGSKRTLLALMASSVIFSAGCSNLTSTAPGGNPFSSPATLSGKIQGGNQPVIGSTVALWYAGQSGAAVQAATTTTDATGSFSFTKGPNDQPNSGTTSTYSCPTSGNGSDPLVYVVSKGGNTQNNGVPTQTNTAAAFIAVFGICTQINASSFVYMSEATTVATMAALQQFYNPNDGTIRADGTGQQKAIITNIPNTIALLADVSTGLANSAKAISAGTGGNIAPAVTLTATPETSKINLIANILSACINAATASDPKCTSLFSAAAPPIPNTTNVNSGFSTATDTLQALYFMFTNQGSSNTTNMATLFGLAPATGAPFQPSLATQPTDWSIGISYASTSTCGTATGGTGNFISSPTDITIDSLDNVWFGNAQTGGNLSSISSTGAPVSCVNFDAGASNTGGTMDSLGNVWMAGGTTMYRYNTSTKASTAFPVGVSPLAITADGTGNVYFTAVAGTTGSLYVLPGAASSVVVAPVQISSTLGTNPVRLMPDNTSTTPKTVPGNIWVSSGSTFISKVSKSTAGGNLNGWITTPFTTAGNSYGLSVSTNSSIFVSANDTNSISALVPSGGSWANASGFPVVGNAGTNKAAGISVDGRLNTWIPNNGSPSLSEISFFGANSLTPATGNVKGATYFNSNTALAVDQAGNIWVVGTGNNFVTEIVGGAVPLYAPYAFGLTNGRFQQIP